MNLKLVNQKKTNIISIKLLKDPELNKQTSTVYVTNKIMNITNM